MGQHRPVSERIAEAQAHLASLMAKAAQSEIASSPEVQAIDDRIKEVQSSMLKYNRWYSEGEEKIANFLRRADEWKQRLAEATEKRNEAQTELDMLRTQRKQLVTKLANEVELTDSGH